VQIGNETTGGEIAGVSGWGSTVRLFRAGSEAVRETLGPDVKVAVHFTNPERAGQYVAAAQALEDGGVDYDVFLSSYYAFWHGSLANLTAVLDQVATTYDKEVAVAETSWVSTLEDGDGYPNVIRTAPTGYSASVQGQALAIRDVMQAVADVSDGRGIGTFYWEPAWLPVGTPDQVDANRDLWEQFGSGWASSHSAEFYAPVTEDYGGSSWDNQALFAFDGTPLESLRVYEYARTGSIGPRELDAVEQPRLTVVAGDPVTLPGAVRVSYTDGTSEDEAVTWQDDPAWLLGPGTYAFAGTTAGGHAVTATVTVLADAGVGENLVVNGGFEDGAASWTGTGAGYTIGSWENPYAGERSLHFWSATPYTFTVQQTVTGVPAGQYRLSARTQGDGAGASDTLQISASSGISSVTAGFALTGWLDWQHPQTDVLDVGCPPGRGGPWTTSRWSRSPRRSSPTRRRCATWWTGRTPWTAPGTPPARWRCSTPPWRGRASCCAPPHPTRARWTPPPGRCRTRWTGWSRSSRPRSPRPRPPRSSRTGPRSPPPPPRSGRVAPSPSRSPAFPASRSRSASPRCTSGSRRSAWSTAPPP
jgi:arabinogalactan endo-1,4-beta-galactosidase